MKPIILKTVYKKKKPGRLEAQNLPSKLWIIRYGEIRKIDRQDRAVNWILWAFAISLICTVGIILLVGFGLGGFYLPETLLNKLGWATIGQVAGLVGVAFKFIFKD